MSEDETLEDTKTGDDASPREALGYSFCSDPLFEAAIEFARLKGEVSIIGLQRQFHLGYNRASMFVEAMITSGIVKRVFKTDGICTTYKFVEA